MILVTSIEKTLVVINDQIFKKINITRLQIYFITKRVEELFNLVEDEFATDQRDAPTPQTKTLTRENKVKGNGLQSNELPKPREDVEKNEAMEETAKV